MTETISWQEDRKALIVGSGAILRPHAEHTPDFTASYQEVCDVRLEELAREFSRIAASMEYDPHGLLVLAIWSRLDGDKVTDESQFDMFSFHDEWGLTQELEISRPLVSDPEEVTDAITPVLLSHGASLLTTPTYLTSGGAPDGRSAYVRLTISPALQFTVTEQLKLTDLIRQLLTRREMTPKNPFGAYTLVLTGNQSALLGQPESEWLEVKSKGYGLQNDRQKHELACDIASLANAEKGGVIIVGLATQKDGIRQDVIHAAPGCAPGEINIEQYAEVAKNKIVPPIEGLSIRMSETDGRQFLVIYVPPQPTYIQPVIVRGGIAANDRWTSAAFTIVNRVGSDKWAISAEAVHSMLTAARAALATSMLHEKRPDAGGSTA